MTKRANPKQIKIPGTLPTLRAARALWRQTFAEMEEHETAVEEAAAQLSQAKEDLGEAQKAFRVANAVLREVENVNPQEGLPVEKGPGKT